MPAKVVPQRLDAFLAGDLKLCVRGILSVQDNYIRKADRSPTSTKRQAAAACVFDGQVSKALAALLRQESSTTYEDRKAAMVAKHPPRMAQDVTSLTGNATLDTSRCGPSV